MCLFGDAEKDELLSRVNSTLEPDAQLSEEAFLLLLEELQAADLISLVDPFLMS